MTMEATDGRGCREYRRGPLSDRSVAVRTGMGVTALAVVLMAAGCGDGSSAGAAQSSADEFQRVINVEVLPLVPRDFQERIRITGTIEANRDVTISAEESGVVREILVEKGAFVEEGRPLMRIDDRLLRAQLDEAEANAGLARETWERRRTLFEEDGVGSELDYLEARYRADQAQATVANLTERLERTVIRAPLDGTLESREVEVGTMVSAGTPVARIVQVDPVKVTGGVPERFAGDVNVGSRASVTMDALRGEAFDGRISYVGTTVNPRNRTFAIEIVLPNPDGVVKPEMISNIDIIRRDLEQVIVVPQEAVVRVEEGYVAFVAQEGEDGDVARVRPLEVGTTQRNQVVVDDGLQAGDRLIVVGHTQVANGDRIRVVRTRESLPVAPTSEVDSGTGTAPDGARDESGRQDR